MKGGIVGYAALGVYGLLWLAGLLWAFGETIEHFTP